MNVNLYFDSISDKSYIGYSPKQIRTAYSLSSSHGKIINVGILDFLGNIYIEKNLNVFSKEFNLPEATIEFVGDTPLNNNFDFSAYIEPCADTQWVHAVSPQAHLKVFRVSEYTVKGVIEAVNEALNKECSVILQTFQAPFEEAYIEYSSIYESDAVFVCSAGDYGAGAFFPSCYPSCISVGGTNLIIDKSGMRVGEETAWKMSGGGICNYFKIPDFQARFSDISKLTSGRRGVPDVSFLADPQNGYAVYHSSVDGSFGWYRAGGTSISASVVAGIVSNILSSGIITNKKDILPYLYNLAGGTEYRNLYNKFIDIVTGDNGTFSARKGYDLCTGLGSLINL